LKSNSSAIILDLNLSSEPLHCHLGKIAARLEGNASRSELGFEAGDLVFSVANLLVEVLGKLPSLFILMEETVGFTGERAGVVNQCRNVRKLWHRLAHVLVGADNATSIPSRRSISVVRVAAKPLAIFLSNIWIVAWGVPNSVLRSSLPGIRSSDIRWN
jgi:hypothetical protein